jgi:hypothetical protein
MSLRYEIVKNHYDVETINAYDGETGIMLSIPKDTANSDYQAYLKSLEEN